MNIDHGFAMLYEFNILSPLSIPHYAVLHFWVEMVGWLWYCYLFLPLGFEVSANEDAFLFLLNGVRVTLRVSSLIGLAVFILRPNSANLSGIKMIIIS